MKKVALITGASRGIGAETAYRLAADGQYVVVCYKQQKSAANKIADHINTEGGSAIVANLQLEDRKSIQNVLELAKNHFHSPVSILVNNAAIAQEKPFESISDSDWQTMLQINLQGPFICSQEVIPGMLSQQWGRIINITSIGGQWGGFNQVHYAASKAGLISLTRSLAKIYSAQGITTNAIAVGLAKTDMSANELESEAGKQKVANIPIGRLANTEEIADTVAFLSSEKAAYITGQTINLNGGMYFT